jgi:hypothetical protein
VLVLLALAAAGRADEAAAVRAVEMLDGIVTVDDTQPDKPVVAVNLGVTCITDAELKELKEFKRLRRLDLSATPVTDAGLKELKGLTSLEELYLGSTQVTDAGLQELTELKNLRILEVSGTRVTDAGLTKLREVLPNLKKSNGLGADVWDIYRERVLRDRRAQNRPDLHELAERHLKRAEVQAKKAKEDARRSAEAAAREQEKVDENAPWPYPFRIIQIGIFFWRESPGAVLLGLVLGVIVFGLLLALNRVKWMTKEIRFPGSFLIDALISVFTSPGLHAPPREWTATPPAAKPSGGEVAEPRT